MASSWCGIVAQKYIFSLYMPFLCMGNLTGLNITVAWKLYNVTKRYRRLSTCQLYFIGHSDLYSIFLFLLYRLMNYVLDKKTCFLVTTNMRCFRMNTITISKYECSMGRIFFFHMKYCFWCCHRTCLYIEIALQFVIIHL